MKNIDRVAMQNIWFPMNEHEYSQFLKTSTTLGACSKSKMTTVGLISFKKSFWQTFFKTNKIFSP